LLAFLALEGPQERRYAAELFWMGAQRPLSNLSVALSLLRRAAPELVEADGARVATQLASDAASFLALLDEGDRDGALDLYRGRFLHGVQPQGVGAEIEEWMVATREVLAGRARRAQLRRAAELAREGRVADAVRRAEEAYRLPGAPELDPDEMVELHALFRAGDSPRAAEIEREARDFGIELPPVAIPSAPATAAPALSGSVLPTPATPLVGRDPERLEVAAMLTDDACRLLTITGPGGTGKTRLALQVALDLHASGAFPDGVAVVLLDSLTDPEQVPQSLAEALGVRLQGASPPLQQVAAAIGTRRLLLLLDNFEQLVEGAEQLSDLLGACPNLRLLVSSRERLDLREEWTLPLEGLAFPRAPLAADDDARHYDAVQLFVQRARRTDLRFRAGDDELEAILELCRLMEGSPLGIELAASWVRLLSPAAIAEEVRRNLDFLDGAPRDAPERHRNLRAVFEASWQRLSPREQGSLRRLAVFRGGFRREAAAEVAGATLPLLAGLVDKSLLRVTEAGRYDRHALLFQYAYEKLAELPDELARARADHGRYYGRFVRERYLDLLDGEQGRALAAIEQDLENIRIAWAWAIEAGEDELLLAMCDPVRAFHDTRARYLEAYDLYATAARAVGLEGPLGGRTLGYLLAMQAWFASWLGRSDEADELAQRGVVLLRVDGRPDELAQGLNFLGTVLWRAGEVERAQQVFLETVELVDGRRRINVLNNLAMAEDTLGNYREALVHYREALAWNREANNASQVVINTINLVAPLSNIGGHAEARELLHEALALAREHGFHQTLPYLLSSLGNVLSELGKLAEARTACEEALALPEEYADPFNTMFALSILGRVVARLGDPGAAAGHLVRALTLVRSTQTTAMSFTPIAEAAGLLERRDELLAATLYRMILHHTVSDHATRQFAAERIEALEAHLAPDALVQAAERGEALAAQPLGEAIDLLDAALATRLER
jgi:predicted ATPase/Tfp pilus assembly protein PilF